MSRDKDFKRLVRRRMRRTGESYTAARAQFARTHARRTSATPPGGSAMFPFERFTDQARKALEAAQAEAERGPGRSLGTACLLLGLVADSRSDATRVLHQLGVERQALRAADLERQRLAAAAARDAAAAAEIQESKQRTHSQWDEAYHAWLASWGRG
jgi:ATP-dependent Clp protease ATP-binding subunit ClpA